MIRRLTFVGVACVAIFGLSCVRRAAPVPPAPVPQADGTEWLAEPIPPDEPAVEFPREPLATFGNPRLRHEYSVNSLAFRADGKLLAVAVRYDPAVHLWDTTTG